jgi:hypothetical protein
MTAPKSVDPAGFLRGQVESASPDLLRAMVKTLSGPDRRGCVATCRTSRYLSRGSPGGLEVRPCVE